MGLACRHTRQTEDIRVLLGSHGDVRCYVPLIGVHLSGLSCQTKPFFALSQRLFGPLTVSDVLQNTSDSIDAGGTFDGKVRCEYVPFAKPRIRVFHLVSDDSTSETLIQFFLDAGLKHPLVQYFAG